MERPLFTKVVVIPLKIHNVK